MTLGLVQQTGLALALAALACACDGGGASPAPPPGAGRVQAVAAKPIGDGELKGFCDLHTATGGGKPLSLPPTDQPLRVAAGEPRWINLWATWCKPCVEELPMIERFGVRLRERGQRVAIDYVSADQDAQSVQSFRKAHPTTPESARLQAADSLGAFLAELGLDAGAGLPVHIFTGSDHKLRCVRSGAITEAHFELIAALLR